MLRGSLCKKQDQRNGLEIQGASETAQSSSDVSGRGVSTKSPEKAPGPSPGHSEQLGASASDSWELPSHPAFDNNSHMIMTLVLSLLF